MTGRLVDLVDPGGFRYERKHLVAGFAAVAVDTLIMAHPAVFREAFPPRFVNNVYLDSFDRDSYDSNCAGDAERAKVRVRWYGDLSGALERPTLELKLKRGLLGGKLQYPLPAWRMDAGVSAAALEKLFGRADLPPRVACALSGLEPALINRYRRRYFESFDRRFRITLDREIEYYRPRPHDGPLLASADRESRVVELKYSPEHDDAAATITKHFPFRLSRSSKYANGLAAL